MNLPLIGRVFCPEWALDLFCGWPWVFGKCTKNARFIRLFLESLEMVPGDSLPWLLRCRWAQREWPSELAMTDVAAFRCNRRIRRPHSSAAASSADDLICWPGAPSPRSWAKCHQREEASEWRQHSSTSSDPFLRSWASNHPLAKPAGSMEKVI